MKKREYSIEEIIRIGMKAFEERAKLSPQERFQDLVNEGIIDENGDVIFDPRTHRVRPRGEENNAAGG